MIHDVIIVGAGPGGSAAASFLARRGVDVVLVDKSDFPREKVCGDGLTPQALYWLDRLGCADAVLAATSGIVRSCDLYINGTHALTGRFPDGTIYPDFAVLLDRRRFDHAIMENAVGHGARFRPGRTVRDVRIDRDCAVVTARTGSGAEELRGRIVIGADGCASAVSRAIGNTLKDGVAAISLRTYFRDVRLGGAPIRVYFDRSYFPGYAWIFVDDDGLANVGLGVAADKLFEKPEKLAPLLQRFLESEKTGALRGATRCGAISGGSASFYRPQATTADRVLLIGDAANQADPLNGGGIHKAMEGAFLAAGAAFDALERGDCSRAGLAPYDTAWNRHVGADWQTAELFLTIAKNPALADFCLFLLGQIGKLTSDDPRFHDFCAGVFAGVVSQTLCLSPRMLYHVFPKDRTTWLSFLDRNGGAGRAPLRLAREALASLASAGRIAVRDPVSHAGWGLEVATRTLKLAELRAKEFASAA